MEEQKHNKIETIKTTIQQLIDEKKCKLESYGGSGSDMQSEVVVDGAREILCQLLSQVQQLEEEEEERTKQSLEDNHSPTANEVEQDNETDDEPTVTREIVQELNNVKRQNTITHWLVSGLILITVVWQMSELSMMLKVKNGLAHPFRSVASVLKGVIKRPLRWPKNDDDGEKQNLVPPPIENLVEPPSLPGVSSNKSDGKFLEHVQ